MYKVNAWEKYSKEESKNVFKLAEDYKAFLTFGKTERRIVEESIELLKEKGFKEYKDGDTVKVGDKLYFINRNKNVCVYILGKKPISEGLRILGAHIDSPRIDLKQNPLYEKNEFAYFNTHYYGGIKKYQWVTIPLALVGVVCKKDGSTVNVSIGLDKKDPIVGISDLLIHLSQEQIVKPASKVIEGEDLDVTIGNIPLKGEEKDAVKANILKLLKKKYDIDEEDFVSSEIEVVPAHEARDYGLDGSMVAGYGHDDKSCAFSSLKAILDIEEVPLYTSCCILVDKEEVGSIGATGAQSRFFTDSIQDLLIASGDNSLNGLSKALKNSKMLSSDVSAGYDPLYASAYESENTCYLGHGVVFNKYTGSRGKSGCNDANPEYIAWLRKVLDDNDVYYQSSELGRVDLGGGGTIAYILGNMNMNVIDAGIPVLNMHAPMEIISKADLYEAYKCYKTFLLK